MSFHLATIASGSSGNSNLIISENTLIMSDCGISGKKVFAGLNHLGLKAPDALLLTHPHSDHVKGAYILAKNSTFLFMPQKKPSETVLLFPENT